MKRRDLIALALAIVVILVGGTLLVKTRLVTSKTQLSERLSTAVEKQDSKLFLKQFDKESQVSRFANLGAKGVLKDWQKNATISDKEIGNRLVNDKNIAGAEYYYQFSVQTRTKFLFFKDYYMSASLTKIKPDADIKKAETTVNKQKVKVSDFNDEFFPGKYHFDSKLKQDGDTVSSWYDFVLTGDPAQFALPFNFDSSDYSDSDDTDYDDSADDEDSDSTDKAYATMNDSEYESKADEIGDALDKTYGEEQSTYSSYDDSQYPDYQGNTK